MRFDPSTLVYNDAGLIPAIAQDHETKEVLMMAWMNQEAVEKNARNRARYLLVTVPSGVLDKGRNIGAHAGIG